MTNTSAELSQGKGGDSLPPPNPQPGPPENQRSHGASNNAIFKSGPLFISSKGIGWTSWKKRWFILTQTSLVFFRSDPNAIPQKGNEVNLTLGGIDLNNSGSVIVKPDKKLLTVQFPDGHDGRAFTLKAETTEDLFEWKNALEKALAQAPIAANAMEQNVKDREPVKSTVIGRPILLALEDVDGTPSFLEKALTFIEEHGANVEGILRQAADVDDVERRVREYEQGKVEFSPDEDAHVIGDCVKHVLRELPSSPVPASCCKALLEACRTERGSRISAMRAAINDTFPEPNRRLLQRILLMMQTVSSRKTVNRMSSSAVAACMAPLLLRPLLAGECEIENDFDVGGDGSIQLLQAAAAANHAQAIVITLLEEYNNIFGGGSVSPDIYTDTEESGSESEEATDDDLSYDEDYDDEQDESIQETDEDADDDLVSESYSETGDSVGDDDYDDKDHDHSSSSSKSSGVSEEIKVNQMSLKSLEGSPTQNEAIKSSENLMSPEKTAYVDQSNKPADIVGEISTDQATTHNSNIPSPSSCIKKSMTISNGPAPRHRTILGRTSARKNLSMESIDFPVEDEDEIERLEAARTELQNQIADEVKATAKLQSHIDERMKALQERRLALEQDVARLQEQFHKEKNSRVTLEAKAELEELALVEVDLANLERKVEELGVRLNVKLEQNYGSTSDIYNPPQISNQERKLKYKADTEVAATSQSERSISKDTQLGGAESDTGRKPESTHVPNKQPPTSSKKYGSRGEDTHLGGAESDTERKPEPTPLPNKQPPTGSRKSGSRGEDTHLGGAESDTERKPEPTPLPNKQPPTSSKKFGSRGEDTHLGGAESDTERKPEPTPLPNKQPPTSFKKSGSRGEDTHLGGAESDTERKPEPTPLPNKQPPSGSKKSSSRGEDTHLGGAESDTERKPEPTPLPNKQPPSGSKKSSSRGEDTHLGGAESDTERKPEPTPLPNKQPPSGSKKSSSRGGDTHLGGAESDTERKPEPTPLPNKQPSTGSKRSGSRGEDTHLGGAESDTERKPEPTPLPNKQPTTGSKRSGSRGEDTHLGGAESDTERKPEPTPLPNKQPPTGSKKSGSRGEGANSTTSALTKLTSRLNFLKVARSQAANELQNVDKGRESSHSGRNLDKGTGSERHQTLRSPRKFRGSDTYSVPNPEKGRVLDSSQTPQISDKGSGKGKSHQNSDKLRKSDSQPSYHSDGWNQNPKHLERGRSEGHHQSYNVDKGR